MASVSNTTTNGAEALYQTLNGNSQKTETKKSAGEEMQDRFLTLLMAQIRSQDPLNPMENAEFTSQLAQMNTVNGIEKLNSSLNTLLAGYGEAQAMQAAVMIGKNVMVAGNNLPLSAKPEGEEASRPPSLGGLMLSSAADEVTVTIKDASGKTVQTQSLGSQSAGSMYFAWDGKDDAGNEMAAGNYSFTVEAKVGGEKVEAKAMQIGMVNAVVRNNNGFSLDLGSMGEVSFSDVHKII